MNKPPAVRATDWSEMNSSADACTLRLQVCGNCGTVQYPPREMCGVCLRDTLHWEAVSDDGDLLSFTDLYASQDSFFRSCLPLRLGIVKLDCGPTIVAYLGENLDQTGSRVRVVPRRDRSGQAVLIAIKPGDDFSARSRNLDRVLSSA